MEQYYITAKEVQEIMQICESMAYRIIAQCNEELKSKGFITVRGKCPRKYLFERVGLSGVVENAS